jgi:hypothetical protein
VEAVDVVVDSRVVLDSPVVDNVVVSVAIFWTYIKRPFTFLVEKPWKTFSAHIRSDELDIETIVDLNLYPVKWRSSATEL